jgi:hypothetical protein
VTNVPHDERLGDERLSDERLVTNVLVTKVLAPLDVYCTELVWYSHHKKVS